MRIKDVYVVRKANGNIIAFRGKPAPDKLGDGTVVASCVEGPEAHGVMLEEQLPALLARDIFMQGVKWARANPDKLVLLAP